MSREPIKIPEKFGVYLPSPQLRRRIAGHARKMRARNRNAAIVDLLTRALDNPIHQEAA